MKPKEIFIIDTARSFLSLDKVSLGDEINDGALASLGPVDLGKQILSPLYKRMERVMRENPRFRFRVGTLLVGKQERHQAFAQALVRDTWEEPPYPNAAHSEGMCLSSLYAIENACTGITLGDEIAIGGGLDKVGGYSGKAVRDVVCHPVTGELTARIADKKAIELGITREELDEYAWESYENGVQYRGTLSKYAVPIFAPDGTVLLDRDEGLYKKRTLKALKDLPPFEGCNILTKAHLCKDASGGAFFAFASGDAVLKYGISPIARIFPIESWNNGLYNFPIAVNVVIMNATKNAGMGLYDIDAFFIEETSDITPVYAIRALSIPRHKVNPCGGSGTFGHSYGASGAVLLNMALSVMEPGENGIVAVAAPGVGASACVVQKL